MEKFEIHVIDSDEVVKDVGDIFGLFNAPNGILWTIVWEKWWE